MDLNDHRWTQLRGGYKELYDPRPAVRKLDSEVDAETVWDELWNELHHQGDIGEASYAAIIVLVDIFRSERLPDWKLFSLAATIEVERHRKTNPPIPEWLVDDYASAWKRLAILASNALQSASDFYTVQSSLAILALANRAYRLGALINWLDYSELEEIVNDKLAWCDLYTDASEQIVFAEPAPGGSSAN